MLVVNLFAGPGAGKSTIAAGLFYELKMDRVRAELVTEFAKDLEYEGRTGSVRQITILGEQAHRLHRLHERGVDVVITDSPLLLSTVYSCDYHVWEAARVESDRYKNVNFFIERKPDTFAFQSYGRSQTLEEAENLDVQIKNKITYYTKEWTKVPQSELAVSIIYNTLVNFHQEDLFPNDH